MQSITIQKISITDLETDAIVNAANSGLWPGGGVCGAIFKAAGYLKLLKACRAIGHCDTGCAVITPGFALKAQYIVHAVGPVWNGGENGEAEQLFQAYDHSLELALANQCRSIGFPLISAGIYGYPMREAWLTALDACAAFLDRHPEETMKIIFAVLSDNVLQVGREVLLECPASRYAATDQF